MNKGNFIYIIVLLLGLAISIDMLMKKDKTNESPTNQLETQIELLLELGQVYSEVDELPRFPGCETDVVEDKAKCAENKMLEYMYQNIDYPEKARRNNIEGLVKVGFIVDKQGKIRGSKIIEDIGGGCGEEAIRIVNSMNDLPVAWIPAKKDGEVVNVNYNLSVRYQLDYY